jgi:hypothetical protein
MGLERYVVDVVPIEKRSPTEIAKAHGISRSWLYQLINRVKTGGYEALEPHSRRPRSRPRAVGEPVIATVLELRRSSPLPVTMPDHKRSPTTSRAVDPVASRLAARPPGSTRCLPALLQRVTSPPRARGAHDHPNRRRAGQGRTKC